MPAGDTFFHGEESDPFFPIPAQGAGHPFGVRQVQLTGVGGTKVVGSFFARRRTALQSKTFCAVMGAVAIMESGQVSTPGRRTFGHRGTITDVIQDFERTRENDWRATEFF